MSRKASFDILKESFLPVNCKSSGGGIIPVALPVRVGTAVPDGVIYACRAESAGGFFLCTPTDVYVSVRGGDFSRLNALSGSSPFLVEEISDGVPRAVIINGENAVAHTGSEFRGVYTGGNLVSGVMRCGRLFAADGENPLMLRWSGEGGVGDWEEKLGGAGHVLLDPGRGEILNLVNLGEKLVAVRKYGLTLIDAFGNPENFSVGITDTDTDEIYKNTAAVAGGKLYFFTASGLHCYDGEIKRTEHRYSGHITAPKAAVGFAENYYLACGEGIMCYDCSDGESYLIDIVADGICAAECVYIFNSTGAYRIDGEGEYSFTVKFGSCKQTVTEIFIGGKADLTLNSGKRSRTFKNACGTIRPRLRGESFTLAVSGTGAISSIVATAEVLNGI